MALVGAPSRFSVLKTDVADPSERKKAPVKAQPVVNNNKKQQQQQTSKKNVKNSNNNNNANNNNKKKKPQPASGETSKFDEWKKRDEKLMESTYEKELQEAILMSRLEQEQKVVQQPRSEVSTYDPAELKKKGKVTLSLQEFNVKFVDDKPPSPTMRASEPLSKLLTKRKEQEEEEQKLRLVSEREASAIVAREKMQQEVIEKAAQPKTVPQEEYDQMLEMKRKQIEHMAKVLNTTNKELAILQEQNADLERVLAKGELKKKTELIREVEELRQVKDELTEQIQTLYVALEQEKSKNHQLTQELQKRR